MNQGLSERQQSILDFIRVYLAEHGYPPSNREIGHATGITSTSVVDYNLRRMEHKGILTCDPKISRGIKLSSGALPAPAAIAAPSVKLTRLPILGYIAAGKPIDAVEDPSEAIDLASDLASDDCYVLRVKGKSMIEDLIDDGDMVVVRSQETAKNGEIVVAMDGEANVTLKRFYYEPGKGESGSDRVRLQPANSEMQPIYVPADQVRIRGKVVTVIRQIR